MKNQAFSIIVLLCAGFGTIITAYFSGSVEGGQGFGTGIIFCFMLWVLFKYKSETKPSEEEEDEM